MTARIAFHVAGDPIPQGSTKSFKRGEKIVTTNDPTGRIERWRGDVRRAAKDVLPPSFEPLTGPVHLSVLFLFRRPKSHYLPANRSRPEPVLRSDAPEWHDIKPDADRWLRAVQDALTAVVWVDDAQVASIGPVRKRWATLPGAAVEVAELLP